MGADGHIRIMDFDKLVRDKLGDSERAKLFADVIADSLCYFQKLQGKILVTDYWGDNIYCRSILYNIATYGLEKGNWEDPFYFDGFLKSVDDSKFERDEFLTLTNYLWNDCHVTDWEVWT